MRSVRRLVVLIVIALPLLFPARPGAQPAPPRVIDDFEDVSRWSAHPADGVELKIGSGPGFSGRAMQLDFKFSGGGYAVAHRDVSLDLPENYAFSFRIRGESLPNTLEFKLIDSTGANVWWSVRRDIEFPREWKAFSYRKRQMAFAWGPAGGGEIRHVAAIEFSVTAGQGGAGTVWIDDLEIRKLPPPDAAPPRPVAAASSERKGHGAALAVDGNPATTWMSTVRDRPPWLALDLVEPREYGGLVIDWAPGRNPIGYDVETSDDGRTWRLADRVRNSDGGRDYIYLPETESRYLRISNMRSYRPEIAIQEITLKPLEWSASRNAFYQAIAGGRPRGLYPRSLIGEQSYWTVVGVDGDTRDCLFGEDGAIEVGRGSFSIEPFVATDAGLVTWADVRPEQWLEDGYLPIPSVRWRMRDDLEFGATAFAAGPPESSSVVVRYWIVNRGRMPSFATLHLAIRPFQVNPPAQFLNLAGGFAPVREIRQDAEGILVNGDQRLVAIPKPAVGVTPFNGGDVVADYLDKGLVPDIPVTDSAGTASGVLEYPLRIEAGNSREVDLVIPLHGVIRIGDLRTSADLQGTPGWVGSAFDRAKAEWHRKLDGVTIDIPGPGGADLVATLRAQLAYILLNRAGPAIQPGTRSYARSWIRDGSLTSSALLRLGVVEPVREFIEWFAPHQYANGKIPCVVDQRGADPVPEHDSSGEFIFLVAEYYRYTHDRALLEQMWPRVVRAAEYLDSLRQEGRPATRDPASVVEDQRLFYGILPPSISHEGYSAKPMHSYWDDFFALRGFRDAVFLAGETGDRDARRRFTSIRDEFQADFVNSIAAAMRAHQIDYIPGCADLGDFDATSTSIALSPVGADDVLPADALRRTFDRYHDFFTARIRENTWDALTPYEARNIGAFVRLGRPAEADEVSKFLLSLQRPAGWHVWAEVVGREERKSRFIGDMPHSWVGSDFIRSTLDRLAYDHDSDSTLVIAAGIPPEWLTPDKGVTVRGLPTPYGLLSYTVERSGDLTVVNIDGGIRVPAGGIVVVNKSNIVRQVPATVTIK